VTVNPGQGFPREGWKPEWKRAAWGTQKNQQSRPGAVRTGGREIESTRGSHNLVARVETKRYGGKEGGMAEREPGCVSPRPLASQKRGVSANAKRRMTTKRGGVKDHFV